MAKLTPPQKRALETFSERPQAYSTHHWRVFNALVRAGYIEERKGVTTWERWYITEAGRAALEAAK